MGFWSSLAHVAAIPASFIPGIGGPLSKVLSAAGDVGNALGGAAKGRADARVQEALIQQRQNQSLIDKYRAELAANAAQNEFNQNAANIDLNQRKFALSAPGARAGNAVRGDILANARDVSFSGLPSSIPRIEVQGGLRPSMFSENTRNLGRALSAQALAEQQKGDTFNPLTYVQPPSAPAIPGLPQAGGLDSLLNAAGTVGSLAGVLARQPWLRPRNPNDYMGTTGYEGP